MFCMLCFSADKILIDGVIQGALRGLNVTVFLGMKLEKMFNSISFNSATFKLGQATSSKVLRQWNISILFLMEKMSERS